MPAFNPPTALSPYTAWMYGAGRAFDFFTSDRAAEDHTLTGVLERPAGHGAASSPAPLTGAGLTVPLLAPTLWSGLPEPRFVPFTLDGVTAQSLTSASLDALWHSAAGAGVSSPTGGLGPKSPGDKTRISAGSPIRSDTVVGNAGGTATMATDPSVDASEPIVVIGVIDDGIPFAHAAFGDRIEAVWLQGMAPDGSGSVRIGREVTRAQITQLKANHGPDEDAVYRAAGALGGEGRAQSPLIGDACHGAHTLGALADGSDAQVRIIAVDLPPDTTWDTSGQGKEALIIAGMHYIFDRADALAQAYAKPTLPMVINLSYGFYGGGHDGEGIIEAALDELIEARRAKAPTGFTMPAGNSFLDSLHAAIDLKAGKSPDPLIWRLPPDDRTSTFMEIWLPKGAKAGDLEVTLHSPGQAFGRPGPIAASLNGAGAEETELTVVPVTWQGKTVGHLSVDCTRGGRWRFMVALAPTEAVGDAAPAGAWHIGMKDKRSVGADITARLRIQRDVSYGRGYTGARQSYFFDPDNALFTREGKPEEKDTPGADVQRLGSFSGMATGSTSLVVGAAKGWGSGAELYSGAANGSDSVQVDVSAMVSKNLSEVGRLGLASRSGARHRMTGTSVAAPAIGAVLREAIANAKAGQSAGNYKAEVVSQGGLAPSDPEAPERLGTDTLN
ncbi:MAG: hypothetical protein AAGA47_09235 [Pseudomonadota bacterium]